MPLTNKELIRKHLVAFQVGQVDVRDLRIVLSGIEVAQLPHVGLTESSVVVKAPESSSPVQESLILTADWVPLANSYPVTASFVVADNTSLTTVYTENIDFTVDYATGRIRRIDSGAITSGRTVAVWYFYHRRYVSGSDYILDATLGHLRRLDTGVIEDGQNVLVDYVAGPETVTDETIDQAIAEADEVILKSIDEQFEDSSDPVLIAAETHWAVAILCRVRAAAELSATGPKTSAMATAARTWLELAAQYQSSATELLKPFRRPLAAMRPPISVSRG